MLLSIQAGIPWKEKHFKGLFHFKSDFSHFLVITNPGYYEQIVRSHDVRYNRVWLYNKYQFISKSS